MSDFTFSADSPALYVSEGFAEDIHQHGVERIIPDVAHMQAMEQLARSSTIPHLGGVAIQAPGEGRNATFYPYIDGANDTMKVVDEGASWDYIEDVAHQTGHDALRLKRAGASAESLGRAFYRAAAAYRGPRSMQPNPGDLLGAGIGGLMGAAVPLIERAQDMSPALDLTHMGEYGAAGALAGAVVLGPLVRYARQGSIGDRIDGLTPLKVEPGNL